MGLLLVLTKGTIILTGISYEVVYAVGHAKYANVLPVLFAIYYKFFFLNILSYLFPAAIR